ncbi:MAG: hypothetical protein GY862_13380 [Gammaproteobacteria bacterium]|nr:hypothetical protein [Gammaproteobacteria bacterium]
MAVVSIAEGAKLTGKATQTIYRHIAKGKLSAVIGADDVKRLDTSELERVYGSLKDSAGEQQHGAVLSPESADYNRENGLLREHNDILQQHVEQLKNEIERLHTRLQASEEREGWFRNMFESRMPERLPAPAQGPEAPGSQAPKKKKKGKKGKKGG